MALLPLWKNGRWTPGGVSTMPISADSVPAASCLMSPLEATFFPSFDSIKSWCISVCASASLTLLCKHYTCLQDVCYSEDFFRANVCDRWGPHLFPIRPSLKKCAVGFDSHHCGRRFLPAKSAGNGPVERPPKSVKFVAVLRESPGSSLVVPPAGCRSLPASTWTQNH